MTEELKGMAGDAMQKLKELLVEKGEWESVWNLVPVSVRQKL